MAQQILTLANPAGPADGVGAAVAVPVSDDFKTFWVGGTFVADHAVLEISQDGVNWDRKADIIGANQAPISGQFAASQARLRLIGFRSGTPIARLGIETLSVAALSTVNVTVPASGAGPAASVVGFGRRKTFVLNGGATANANAVANIEVSLDGGVTFTGLAPIQGGVMTDAPVLIVEGVFTHVRVNVLGGTSTGLTLSVTADPTSADAGQPISVNLFSGRHIGGAGATNHFVSNPGVEAPMEYKFSGRHAGAAGAATNFIADLGVDAATVLLTNRPDYRTKAGVAKNLRVKPAVNTLAAATNVTVFKNGAATALTVVVGAGSVAAVDDLVNQISFADGDTIDVRADSNAAGAGNNVAFSATVEFVPVVAAAVAPQYVMAQSVVRNLRVKPIFNNMAAATNVTVFKNGVATAITVAVPAGSTAIISDLVNVDNFAAGDRLDVRADSNAAGAANNIAFSATVEVVPAQL